MCKRCASCQRCSAAKSCELDPNSSWDLTAESASLDPLAPDGLEWDIDRDRFGGSLPDPFVQLEMPPGNAVGWTTTLVDTLSPVWNETLHAGNTLGFRAREFLPGGSLFILWVGDQDSDTRADIVCDFSTPFEPAAFTAGRYAPANAWSCRTLTIKLTCRPESAGVGIPGG